MDTGRSSKNAESEKAKASDQPAIDRSVPEARDGQYFIAGLGGSAGGLEAFEEFFKNLPPDTGIGYVLVTHLDPIKKDIMPELIRRFTRMPVAQAENDMAVLPDHVYVIPPNRDMTISGGILVLQEPSTSKGVRMPIDVFLRSLATDRREMAIARCC